MNMIKNYIYILWMLKWNKSIIIFSKIQNYLHSWTPTVQKYLELAFFIESQSFIEKKISLNKSLALSNLI